MPFALMQQAKHQLVSRKNAFVQSYWTRITSTIRVPFSEATLCAMILCISQNDNEQDNRRHIADNILDCRIIFSYRHFSF